eukprot:TRINITY_DN1503_c2_g1_i1.p1 TRINITY_DN1503_c2_g1~~TRINITY_DN1503_c2_g1_i1.p1  ORF type:complete len:903 (-),score=185.45 TRINITY_DN1503_c2_g1_i1:50-2623(-)
MDGAFSAAKIRHTAWAGRAAVHQRLGSLQITAANGRRRSVSSTTQASAQGSARRNGVVGGLVAVAPLASASIAVAAEDIAEVDLEPGTLTDILETAGDVPAVEVPKTAEPESVLDFLKAAMEESFSEPSPSPESSPAVAAETAVPSLPDTVPELPNVLEASEEASSSAASAASSAASSLVESDPVPEISNVLEASKEAAQEAATAGSSILDSVVESTKDTLSDAPLPFEMPSVPAPALVPEVPDIPELSEAVPEPARSAASKLYEDILKRSEPVATPSAPSGGSPFDFFTTKKEEAAAALESLKSALTSSVDNAKSAVTSTVDGATSAIRDTLDSGKESINSSVNSSTESVFGVFKSAQDQVTAGVTAGTESLNLPPLPELPALPPLPPLPPLPRVEVPDSVKPVLKSVSDGVVSLVGQGAATVSDAVGKGYGAIKGQLPPEALSFVESAESKYQEFYDEYSEPVGSFIKKTTGEALQLASTVLRSAEVAVGLNPDDPIVGPSITAALVLTGSIIAVVLYREAQASGYAGDLAPEDALQLLREEFDALLLDIRPQYKRETDGIPDLRRGARFKDASVEITKMTGPIRGLLKNANDVDLQMFAATVRGLKGVGSGTKIVVMDENGGSSRDIARALRKFGSIQRPYRMEGGFQAWAVSQRVKPDETESLIEIVKKETEAIIEEVQPNPAGITAVLAGFALAIYALTEWEKALQFLGVIGISRFLFMRFQTYDSADDVKKDIQKILKPFAVLAGGAVAVGSFIDKTASSAQASPVLATAGGGSLPAGANAAASAETSEEQNKEEEEEEEGGAEEEDEEEEEEEEEVEVGGSETETAAVSSGDQETQVASPKTAVTAESSS